jgi:hypothetical protein
MIESTPPGLSSRLKRSSAGHRVGFDERQIGSAVFRSGTQERRRVHVDPDHFSTTTGQLTGKKSITTADIQRAAAIRRHCSQHDSVIVDIAVPETASSVQCR